LPVRAEGGRDAEIKDPKLPSSVVELVEEMAKATQRNDDQLRHWEQGKRRPEGPTRAYLLVIERAPGGRSRRRCTPRDQIDA
jgi:hypothetical protein